MPTAPSPTELRCSIARTMEILGAKWSILIVRNALRGMTKFSEFRDGLGIPSDVLTARLASLVDAGILERRSYKEPGDRQRSSYHLTESGRDLKIMLAAIAQWGEVHRPTEFGTSTLHLDTETAAQVHVAFVDPDDEVVPADRVAIRPGPGALTRW
jgi:DNA-binding HxlR family transcriptional regulator